MADKGPNPTRVRPGPAKINVLARRARQKRPLWQDGDAAGTPDRSDQILEVLLFTEASIREILALDEREAEVGGVQVRPDEMAMMIGMGREWLYKVMPRRMVGRRLDFSWKRLRPWVLRMLTKEVTTRLFALAEGLDDSGG